VATRIGAVLVVVALTGCGDTIQDLLPHASCTNATLATCQDYGGPGGSPLATFEAACTNAGGLNGSAACPAANRVGSCSIPTGVPGVTLVTRFYTPPWDVNTAAANCTGLQGSFTPG